MKINLRTNRRGLKTIEAEEYLPKQIVENFLPFNCLIKLDEMAHRHMAEGIHNVMIGQNAIGGDEIVLDLTDVQHEFLPGALHAS